MNESETVTVSVTIDPELLGKIDEQSKKLDLNRSQYFRRLAREDLLRRREKSETAVSEAA